MESNTSPIQQHVTPQTREWALILGVALAVLFSGLLFYLFVRGDKPVELELGPALVTPQPGIDFADGVIVFGLKEKLNPTTQARMAQFGLSDISPIIEDSMWTYTATLAPGVSVLETQNKLRTLPEVTFTEPDYFMHLESMPSDPYYYSSNTWGQGVGDLWNLKMIDMERAWSITKGSPDVVVGIVDTGIDHTHPDLEGQVLKGTGGFLAHYGLTYPGDCQHTHGTHIAGTIAAKENNIGVVGVAPNVKVAPFAFFACDKIPPEKLGVFTYEDKPHAPLSPFKQQFANFVQASYISRLVIEAAPLVDVMNLSMGFDFHSTLFDSALNYAHNKGAVIVASSGNENRLAGYFSPGDNPHVILVGATNEEDKRAVYSNYGDAVTVAAPGGERGILSTGSSQMDLSTFKATVLKNGEVEQIPGTVGDGYIFMNGTSMAAPHVSGLAALVRSLHPDWSPEKVRCAVILGAEDAGIAGKDRDYGYGRINAYRTLLLKDVPDICGPVAHITDPLANSGVPIDSSIQIRGIANSPNLDYYILHYLPPNADPKDGWVIIEKSSISGSDALGIWRTDNLSAGDYRLRLTVRDKNGDSAHQEIGLSLFNSVDEGQNDSLGSTTPTLVPISGSGRGQDVQKMSCNDIISPIALSNLLGSTWVQGVDEIEYTNYNDGLYPYRKCEYFKDTVGNYSEYFKITIMDCADESNRTLCELNKTWFKDMPETMQVSPLDSIHEVRYKIEKIAGQLLPETIPSLPPYPILDSLHMGALGLFAVLGPPELPPFEPVDYYHAEWEIGAIQGSVGSYQAPVFGRYFIGASLSTQGKPTITLDTIKKLSLSVVNNLR